MTTTEVSTRYACAHVAALRAAAALLAARARPAAGRRRPQKNAWVLLAEVAPELGEWAGFFAAGAAKRAAAEAGSTRAVTEREADDLVRDADRFLGVVEQSLGPGPARPAAPAASAPGGLGGHALMPDPFVHLHVASGYSLRYGASHPQTLVERAAEQEMDTLALTDRDGVYGAVKFARACYAAGIRPVLGVELAHRPVLPGIAPTVARTRTPVRGGTYRDPVGGGLPRVTFLATADSAGGGRAGWAALCRLISATHLAGERGVPVLDLGTCCPTTYAGALAAGDLMVLLGPASELARAALCSSGGRRDDLALAALAPVARAGAAHPPAGRAGLPPAPGRRCRRRRLGPGHHRRTPPGWPGSPARPGSGRC